MFKNKRTSIILVCLLMLLLAISSVVGFIKLSEANKNRLSDAARIKQLESEIDAYQGLLSKNIIYTTKLGTCFYVIVENVEGKILLEVNKKAEVKQLLASKEMAMTVDIKSGAIIVDTISEMFVYKNIGNSTKEIYPQTDVPTNPEDAWLQ